MRAEWPGSNGSVMGTNAIVLGGAVTVTAAEGAVALLPLAAAVVPGVALFPADEFEPLQPASTPMPMADTAAMASLPPFTGRRRRDSPMSLPSLQAAGVRNGASVAGWPDPGTPRRWAARRSAAAS
jgi:hypothetical protein